MKDDPTIDREWPGDRATDGAKRTRSEDVRSYRDGREHVLDELRRIDLLLRDRVAAWRSETGGGADEFSGYYISDEEVDRLLGSQTDGRSGVTADSHEGHGGGRERRERADRLSDWIAARIRATRQAGAEPDLRLARLIERFDLTAEERDILLLAVAPEFDSKYETIFAYLHDDLTRKRPTVDLILRTLVTSAVDRFAVRRLFARTSPLRRNGLVRVARTADTALPSRPVQADERIADYLLGSDALDDALSEFAEVVEPETTFSELQLDSGVGSQLKRLRRSEGDGGGPTATMDPPIAYFYGPYGSGRGSAIEALCSDLGRPLIRADARGLAACCGDAADLRDAVDRLLREAKLREGDVAVTTLDAISREGNDAGRTERLLRALDGFDGRVFLTAEGSPTASQRAGVTEHAFVAVDFPIPSYERRRDLWRGVDDLPADIEVADLAGKFRLTGGQIADAVETARSLTYGEELTAEAVYAGCRTQSRETLGSLGSVVEPNYGWGDIVLPADEKAHLREVAAHIKHQGRVYADWGFERKFSLGNGVVVLFTGPSGTGKTMAAEIIANDAGLDLYKIDLSNVVSKYIGETEKNLGEVFDEAENSDAILFFDEADALFGKRSEVSDAHDRYANIEVNYLLQRVEEHDGAVILTTNFKGNIDDAFLRRIHLSVDFPLPDETARERIWRGVFPAETPVGKLDYEFLSEFELTGGNIKNVALTAAFMAASGERTEEREGARWAEAETVRRLVSAAVEADDEASLDFLDRVEMEHVVRAMRREFQKTGKLLKDETFGEYRRLLVE